MGVPVRGICRVLDYVSIDYAKRHGQSKIKPIRDTLGFATLIIRTVLYFNPLKIFYPVAGLLSLVLVGSLVHDFFIEKPANLGDKTVLLFVAMIQVLIDKGYAYEADSHVLFDVTAYDDYGKLSKRDLREMIAGSRVEVAPYKRAAHDFVLWKPSTPELPGWDSPWGRGRPGWHLECSAMIRAHLGETIDIHGGGKDLIFPHHENEIAQSVCSHGGHPFAKFWMHNGFVTVEKRKMSKSLGNFRTVRDLLQSYRGEVLRFALLSAHYPSPLNFSVELLEQAEATLESLYSTLRDVQEIDVDLEVVLSEEPFYRALNDDLNTPVAIAEVHSLAKQIHKAAPEEKPALKARMLAAGNLLGILGRDPEEWLQGNVAEGDIGAAEIETLSSSLRATTHSRS